MRKALSKPISVSEEQPCAECRNWLSSSTNPRQGFRKVNNVCFNVLEIPRHQSKILAGVKKEDNRAEIRAKTFLLGS